MFLHLGATPAELTIYHDYNEFHKGKSSWDEVLGEVWNKILVAYESNSHLCPECRTRALESYNDRLQTTEDYQKSNNPTPKPRPFNQIGKFIFCRCGLSVARLKIDGKTRCFKRQVVNKEKVSMYSTAFFTDPASASSGTIGPMAPTTEPPRATQPPSWIQRSRVVRTPRTRTTAEDNLNNLRTQAEALRTIGDTLRMQPQENFIIQNVLWSNDVPEFEPERDREPEPEERD